MKYEVNGIYYKIELHREMDDSERFVILKGDSDTGILEPISKCYTMEQALTEIMETCVIE